MKQRKRCKYQTIDEIAALVECDHIMSGIEQNMNEVNLDISLLGKA